ncbi:NIPSNAP family protein [Arcicella aquatica]|uniref:NIPSNAP family protein n=1 Tax=Arcicella aquatica TaxID=217141 RepID=A0ABU5QKX4_9BACT|nr:NIPSNAP family protein [Arcicella aquatica]MEA5257707.1 NIPSNAP family protein [Arcicella aquatica]
MKSPILAFLVCLLTSFSILAINKTDDANSHVYELRVYYASEGKFDVLMNRFKEHTLHYFKKHKMRLEGFWLPLDNKDNKMVYVLSYPSREAREKSWKDFSNDKGWIKVAKETNANGEIVAKVESTFLKTTDFSPNNLKSVGDRVFELRTYKTTPNNLSGLLERFRNHTLKLFERHGMTNIIYWTPTDKEQGADNTLIYFLAHKSQEAGIASFKSFRDDPEWIAVRKASEEKGGGSLTVTVTSEYLSPVPFSPLK